MSCRLKRILNSNDNYLSFLSASLWLMNKRGGCGCELIKDVPVACPKLKAATDRSVAQL